MHSVHYTNWSTYKTIVSKTKNETRLKAESFSLYGHEKGSPERLPRKGPQKGSPERVLKKTPQNGSVLQNGSAGLFTGALQKGSTKGWAKQKGSSKLSWIPGSAAGFPDPWMP